MGGLAAIDLLKADRSELLDDVLVRLCSILQLSTTQFSLAESHYRAICEWLGHEESELNQFNPDLYPQGSFALGTTVKPQIGDEYDVDLVCELNVNYRSLPRPVLLLDLIEKRMRQSDRYRDRLERKKRCLRVNYEHAFHLDILPACPDPGAGSTCLVIPDREVRWLRLFGQFFLVSKWKNCSASRRRGGGNVKIGCLDFQGLVGRAENSSIVFRPSHETGISTACFVAR